MIISYKVVENTLKKWSVWLSEAGIIFIVKPE